MKRLSLIAILSAAAFFIACGGDSSSSSAPDINGGDTSSSSNGGNGGKSSGKACLNTFLDGEIRCFTHESVEFLCGGTSSGLKSSELIDECPEGYTFACPDETGNGVTYFYRDDMESCHKF